jgi:hypothetical protein
MSSEGGKKRALLSEVENLGVGVVGGTVETVINMPVLTAKFCLQEGRPFPKSFGGFYVGTAMQAGNVAPITALQMVANGVYEKYIFGATESKPLNDVQKIGCSCLAGASSALLYSPVDLTMIQQQKLGMGPGATISHIMSTHGATTMLRGVTSMAVREALYTAGYLGLAPVVCARMAAMPGRADSHLTNTIGSSILAGTLAAMVTHPVDTAKTKVQADVEGKVFKSALTTMPKIWAEEGIKGFYRGGLCRTIRTCVAFMVVSALREAMIVYKTNQLYG